MNIDHIKKIEIEITSGCNAACPGCARTQHPDLLTLDTVRLVDIMEIFPDSRHIQGKMFKFCGVLGDPAFNPECMDMVEYLTSHGGFCQLSTNGGIQPAKWWHRLGAISGDTRLVEVNFCVDGHRETNHIYRVNTNFDVIERNMRAYRDGGQGRAQAMWIFIVFDHNEHELSKAEQHAKDLGFKFATRTGMRNSMGGWLAQIKKKNQEMNRIETEIKTITVSRDKEHQNKHKVIEIDKFIHSYTGVNYQDRASVGPQRPTKPKIKSNRPTINLDDEEKEKIISTIVCKLIHEGEIFIASDLSMWPCCFLWDSYFKDHDDIRQRLSDYGPSFNSLRSHTINEILDHPWFAAVLPQSWNPSHEKHFHRCVRTCAMNKAYQNVITVRETANEPS